MDIGAIDTQSGEGGWGKFGKDTKGGKHGKDYEGGKPGKGKDHRRCKDSCKNDGSNGAKSGKAKGQDKTFQGFCSYCNLWGHRRADCP